ncbi:Astacin-like metalloendopeptidase [Strongyloides ratti]|uniref:Metalloendopeptidase n=1 Tax=Strongyloides ratti TaxID=34506 RepID=A0A090MLM6_STRRB|nr:Astacin-like metalloendopeptidase [Strongyloides ratti]CEG06136.1 Astacin-like metalloendopeptidase [Strongyloides ratti]
MINLEKFFLYSAFYILYIFPYIITSAYFSLNDEYLEKGNVKRSIEKIINFKYDNEIMDDLSINNRKKRNIKIKLGKFRWDSFIDYYVSFPLGHSKIKKVINVLETTTCLRFREAKSLYGCVSGILFVSSTRCHSHLGRETDRNWQRIEIARECYNEGEILQLILRTLGVIYEHNRVDRNYFVQVVEENILPFAKKHFELFRKSVFNDKFLPYEYGSIMHFGMYNYSRNGGKTLVTFNRLYENTMGQHDMITFNDIRTLNMHFCSDVCRNRIICENYGYQNPNNCNQCLCIEGYAGVSCEKTAKTRPFCSKSVFLVTNKPLFWNITGVKHCVYHLKANNFHKIKIVLLKVRMDTSFSMMCSSSDTLEIKFLRNKSLTGARFCHQKFPKFIKSHDNYVIIQYKSYDPRSFVHMYFKSSH